MAKKKKNGNLTQFKERHSYKKIGVFLIVFSLFLFLMLTSSRTGFLGKTVKDYFQMLFGILCYIIPFFFFVGGTTILLNKNLKYKSLFIFIFFVVLVLLDNNKSFDISLKDRLALAIEYSKLNTGGGLVGAFFGYFSYKIFGSIGTYFIGFTLIILSLMLILGISFIDLYNFFKSAIVLMISLTKRIKINKTNKEKFEDDIVLSNVNSKSSYLEDFKISDFNKLEVHENDFSKLNESHHDEFNSNIIKNEYQIPQSDEKADVSEKPRRRSGKFNNSQNQNGQNNLNEEGKINKEYSLPPIDLLNKVSASKNNDKIEILDNTRKIEETLSNFGMDVKVIAVNRGPSITCYEIDPPPGVKLSRIVNLSDNLALSLASSDIRIEAPIPGKSAVGIEVPNKVKTEVTLRELISSKEFSSLNSKTPLALGKDVNGNPIVSSIDKMPHLLIAGATGSGKSVCINTIIVSIIFKSSPDDVKLILIDPKVVELNIYNGIPHLMIPVVTDSQKAAGALQWAVGEMEKRYRLFAKNGVRDAASYNKKAKNLGLENLPSIVIIIDELADLMMVSAKEVEESIARLAQMARAAGMYLIVATQRPSVDVITGTIKANIPSRISFAVSSQIDSRTILDMTGAEKLLGKGDMLFFPSSQSKPTRIQGAFVSDLEVENIVGYLKDQYISSYNEDVMNTLENDASFSTDDADPLLPEAIKIVVTDQQASTSYLQRKLKVGYARAARIVDQMEERNIVGPPDGSKPRKILVDLETYQSWSDNANE